MRLGPTSGDDFGAQASGQRNIYQVVAVEVAELAALTQAELHAAETVGVRADTGPRQSRRLDLRPRARDGHAG